MTAFGPPPGDAADLSSAAALLGTVSTDIGGDLSSTTSAVQTAVSDWRGSRQDDFTRAGAGVQVQLKVATEGCAAVSALLGQYAKEFARTTEDVAEYRRLATNAATDADARAGKVDPTSSQYDLLFQHAAQQGSYYASLALAAKQDLAATAGRIAVEIDAQTDKVAPVSSTLTPQQIQRQVDSALGLTGLTGSDSGHVPTDAAWAYLQGAERAVPAGAVEIDGSVDWTAAFALQAPPAQGSSPQAVNAWWAALSPTEQDALLNQQPESVGNLDGVPIIDRDFANRAALPKLIAQTNAQLSALGPAPDKYRHDPTYGRFGPTPFSLSDTWLAWQSKHDALQHMLDGLGDVQSALITGASTQPPMYLIGVQAVGNGRAIVSRGNPDTASNVGTYVPGMGTTLSGISGGLSRTDAMYRATRSAGSSSPAMVCWYGYDAPQGLTSAASEDDAQAAAPLLDSFQTGLRTTHVGAPSLNTVIAHSYGTTVTGYSASHGNVLDADNVVFVASPGTSVNNADELRLTGVEPNDNGDHVYATVAQHDPIQLAAGINGPDPTGLSFGAHDFTSDPGSEHWYELGWSTGAHSEYWNTGNQALTNMGNVIAGNGSATS